MSITNDFMALDARAQKVFEHIIESYMTDGTPVGSRKLSQVFGLSPATLRNVMADLVDIGLLESPHISAGRVPTNTALRFFVDGIIEKGSLSDTERAALEAECQSEESSLDKIYEQASATLSSLSASAGLVVAPSQENSTLRHVEFISIAAEQGMVILVTEDGAVENRMIPLPAGITPDMLRQAGAFLSEKLYGKTMYQMREDIIQEIEARKAEMGALMSDVVRQGLATKTDNGKLIVHGRSKLLNNPTAQQDMIRLQELMNQLESKETVSKLLEQAFEADGVKIYIGAENSIFAGSGQSLILSPYRNGTNNIVGAIGVIGPRQINYAQIIPRVNYMAEILSRRMKIKGP